MTCVTQADRNGLQFETWTYSFTSIFINESQDQESRLPLKKKHWNQPLAFN